MVLPRTVVAMAARPLVAAASASCHFHPSLAVGCIPQDFEGRKLAGMFLLVGSMFEVGSEMTMGQQESGKAAEMVLDVVLAMFSAVQHAAEIDILPT
jgi:hypothetical protein